MPSPIDTRHVTDRRPLRFANPQEALADAERIAGSDRAGTLRRSGNWTAGQVFGHLAAWMNYSFDGYPLTATEEHKAKSRAALHTRVLDGHLLPGVVLPGIEGGTVGWQPLPTLEAFEKLRWAWRRTIENCPTQEHPYFGRLTHEEWIKLQLRHSELHQGFMHPGG